MSTFRLFIVTRMLSITLAQKAGEGQYIYGDSSREAASPLYGVEKAFPRKIWRLWYHIY